MEVKVYFFDNKWLIQIDLKWGVPESAQTITSIKYLCTKPTRKQIRNFIKQVKSEYIYA